MESGEKSFDLPPAKQTARTIKIRAVFDFTRFFFKKGIDVYKAM